MISEEHAKLIDYLEKNHRPDSDPYNAPEHQWVMHSESGIIGTYLRVLKIAHNDLNLAGPFKPDESGHCIAFPAEDGAWVVVPTTADRWYPFNWEPDVALLRAIRRLGPMTAAELLQQDLPVHKRMTPHQLGLRLRDLRGKPIHGLVLHGERGQSDTQSWWVETDGRPSEHPDTTLLRALRPLGPVTAAEALQRLDLIREATPQALGARLRSLKRQGPIEGLSLRRKGKRWWVERDLAPT